jgi:hypothetical protein
VDDLSLKSQAILAATSIAFALTFANSHVREGVNGSKLAWYRHGGSIVVNYLVLGIGRLVLVATGIYYKRWVYNGPAYSPHQSGEDFAKDQND